MDILKNVKLLKLEELILSCNKISYFNLFKNSNNNFLKLKVLKLGGNEIKNISELQKYNFAKLKIYLDIKRLDIAYMIDSTGGMSLWIYCIRSALNRIYNQLNRSIILREYDIEFGGVFYLGPVDVPQDTHEYECLGDVKDLVNRMENIRGE